MRAVFINQCHPRMPHVCGVRLGRFAEAMAARGHEIVLMVQAHPRDAECPSPERVAAELAAHDWSKPYVLPCSPSGHLPARRARVGRGMALMRYATILKSFLVDGGMFPDWQAGARPYFDVLAKAFAPDLIWATFGNTDNWVLAQALSRQIGRPWIADFKDNWTGFIPDGLKLVMARRFRDAAHMTVLSESHCDEADRWFSGMKSVVYSGVDARPGDRPEAFRITIAGSVYDELRLAQLVWGIRQWLGAADRGAAEFVYAGNDQKLVETATTPLEEFCERRFMGYLPLDELAALQASSHVNVYVHNERCLFHHKALELIAAGRPILSYPDESDETRRLASEAGSALFVCADRGEVADALDVISGDTLPMPRPDALADYAWRARAEVLERVFAQVIGRSR